MKFLKYLLAMLVFCNFFNANIYANDFKEISLEVKENVVLNGNWFEVNVVCNSDNCINSKVSIVINYSNSLEYVDTKLYNIEDKYAVDNNLNAILIKSLYVIKSKPIATLIFKPKGLGVHWINFDCDNSNTVNHNLCGDGVVIKSVISNIDLGINCDDNIIQSPNNVNIEEIDDNSILISWDIVDKALSYSIVYMDKDQNYYGIPNTATNSAIISHLENNRNYLFSVSALSDCSQSDYTNPKSFILKTNRTSKIKYVNKYDNNYDPKYGLITSYIYIPILILVILSFLILLLYHNIVDN